MSEVPLYQLSQFGYPGFAPGDEGLQEVRGTPFCRQVAGSRQRSEVCSGSEAGSYLRLIDSCITQLKAQGSSRTCNESKEEETLTARSNRRFLLSDFWEKTDGIHLFSPRNMRAKTVDLIQL